MPKRRSSCHLAFFVALAVPALASAVQPLTPGWADKVAPALLAQAASGAAVEFLVQVGHRPDLSPAAGLPTKQAKGRFVYETLKTAADQTQGPLLRLLRQRGAEFRPLWIAGAVWVRGDNQLLAEIAARPDVRRVLANPQVALRLPPADAVEPVATLACPNGGGTPEWGVQKIGAPAVWAAGFTGQGVVVAGEDTGYKWDHAALKSHYRGWNGATADHNYNWWDAIHAGGGSCGANTTAPCDDFGHGTHTMGTMVGDTGTGIKTGVAPGARWIGCRNMNQGVGTPATYMECFQFFLAPTNLGGTAADPDLAPDVINNSWGCPPDEGCDAANTEALRQAVAAVRAAGIVVVASAGNSGSSCSTIQDPPANLDESFSVGATDGADNISSFSSRGPGTLGGRLKPDVSAPGASVCSSTSNGSYGLSSGTSMAGPHVAGLVALLISMKPCLRGQVGTIEDLLRATAVPRTGGPTCGSPSIPGSQVPNYSYGYGRVQATIPPCFTVGGRIFCDDFEAGATSDWCPAVSGSLLRGGSAGRSQR